MLNQGVLAGAEPEQSAGAAWRLYSQAIPRWLVIAVVVCVAAGVFARFWSLPEKFVYRDEVKTSMHVAGYTMADLRASSPRGIVRAGTLVAQFEQPHAGRTAADTIRVLAQTDPQHPPLYYLIARAWQEAFGDSIRARRALSALFGVLVIPAMFWLALTLFQSPRAAWLAAGLAAVSPYQFVYAQQVREWSLFVLLVLISTALLLGAVDRGTKRSWIAYGASALLLMYCAILSLIVLAAHAVYVVAERRACARNFFAAAGAALLAYVPWLAQLVLRWNQSMDETAYTAVALPFKLYVAKIGFALGSIFFDAEYASLRLAIVAAVALAIAAYAVARPLYDRRLRAAALPLLFVAVNLALFVAADIATHGSRAAQERYLLVAAVGVELLTAYVLTAASGSARANRIASLAAAFLLFAGLVSVAIAQARPSWWDNNDAATMGAAAALIPPSGNAVVEFDDSFAALLFSNVAPPDTKLALGPDAALQSGKPIYALYPSQATLAKLRRATHSLGTILQLDIQADALHAQVVRAHGGENTRAIAWMFPASGTR